RKWACARASSSRASGIGGRAGVPPDSPHVAAGRVSCQPTKEADMTTTDLDTIRERNLRLWTQHTASFEAGDIAAVTALWHEDGRIEVAYPIEGMPPALE